jgi:hypothetical protein
MPVSELNWSVVLFHENVAQETRAKDVNNTMIQTMLFIFVSSLLMFFKLTNSPCGGSNQNYSAFAALGVPGSRSYTARGLSDIVADTFQTFIHHPPFSIICSFKLSLIN